MRSPPREQGQEFVLEIFAEGINMLDGILADDQHLA
jgi:hypothetical protein